MKSTPTTTEPLRTRRKLKADDEQLADDAQALLAKPDLLDLIVADIQEAFNIHGEELLIKMLYVAVSSRRLDDPLSVIVQGPPGSGKTLVIDSICELAPPTDVVVATHSSPKALYYGETDFRHKVYNGKERSRLTGKDAQCHTSAIRQLISDKKIVNRTVYEGKPVVQEVLGPICFLESTTLSDFEIFDEDLSRCLLLRTTSDSTHRRRVLHALGQKYSPRKNGGSQQGKIIAKHRMIQEELLTVRPVSIPFSEQFEAKFPVEFDFSIRLYQRLLFTVAAIAHLHQFQRKRDTNDAVVANLDDYQHAKAIIDRCLADAFHRSLKGAELVLYELARQADVVSQSDLAGLAEKTFKVRRTAAYEAIARLIEKGALVLRKKKSGSQAGLVKCYALPDLQADT